MAKIVLTDVKGFTSIPLGKRLIRFFEYTEKVGKAGTYGELMFKVDDDSEYKGRKARMNSSFGDNSLGFLKQNLLVLGASEDVVNDPEGVDPSEVYPTLIGNTCTGVFIPNVYTGEDGKTVTNTKLGRIEKSEEWA